MADEQNPVFDQTLPTPEPITLTFGEESAPEGKAPEQSAAANPTESASDALAQAKDALSQAQGVLSDVQNAAGATFASNGVSVGDAVNAAGAAMAAVLKLVKSGAKGNIVTVFPDRGDRYFSKKLYESVE